MAFFFEHLPEGVTRVVYKDGLTLVTAKKCHHQVTRPCRKDREQCCLGQNKECHCVIVCHNLHGAECKENGPTCCSYRGDGEPRATGAEVVKAPGPMSSNVAYMEVMERS